MKRALNTSPLTSVPFPLFIYQAASISRCFVLPLVTKIKIGVGLVYKYLSSDFRRKTKVQKEVAPLQVKKKTMILTGITNKL